MLNPHHLVMEKPFSLSPHYCKVLSLALHLVAFTWQYFIRIVMLLLLRCTHYSLPIAPGPKPQCPTDRFVDVKHQTNKQTKKNHKHLINIRRRPYLMLRRPPQHSCCRESIRSWQVCNEGAFTASQTAPGRLWTA